MTSIAARVKTNDINSTAVGDGAVYTYFLMDAALLEWMQA